MRDIIEGLTRNSLENLVLPIISIDEYESKISDRRAIVVGFFVSDEQPASDLSSFVDRSSHPILDTEVSPAPTPEGYYMVFIEMQRDEKFIKTMTDVLGEVENLCDIDAWTFQCPGHKDPIDLTPENLKKTLILDQDDVLEIPDDEDDVESDKPVTHDVPKPKAVSKNSQPILEAVEFWKMATVGTIEALGPDVTLSYHGGETTLRKLDEDAPITRMNVDHEDARRVQSLLGPAYMVYETNIGLLIEHGDDQVFVKIIH